MYCDTETAKVIDPQDTTNNVSAQVVEHEHLPYGVSIGVQNGRRLRDKPIGSGWFVAVRGEGCWNVVEIEYLPQRRYEESGLGFWELCA